MADTSWTQISGYTPQDYTDTLVFEMSAETKKLEKIVGQALVAGEENSQYIKFVLPRYWDGIDISGKSFGIEYALAGTYYGTSEAVNAEMSTDQVRFGWIVPKNACAISGTLFFVLKVDDTDYVLKSQIADTPVFKTIDVGDVVPEPTKEQWYRDFAARVEVAIDDAEAAIEAAQAAQAAAETAAQNAQTAEDNAEAAAAAAQIRYGSPLTAAEADQMIDENRVYVYTGSESGYTAGNWYYYDGSAWVSGGVYNGSGINTDTTLTQSGMAADAKATGDEISQIKEDFTDMVNSAYITDSASGSVAHFVDGADNVPMKSVKVSIAPVQSGSGDPSPSNVRAISGWSSVKVTRSGNNLIPIDAKTATASGVTVTINDDGSLLINGTAEANNGVVLNKNAQLKNYQSGTYALALFGENTTGLSLQVMNNTAFLPSSANIITIPDDSTRNYVRICFASGTTFNNVVVYPMMVYGDTIPTEYEPYNGNEYNISLASAGTVYGGTLDAVSGVLTVDRAIKTFNGSESWYLSNSGMRCQTPMPANAKPNSADATLVGAISNEFVEISPNRTWDGASGAGFGIDTNRQLNVCQTGEKTMTVDAWKTWLASHNMQIVYPLATPITYNLTPTGVKSLLGINNIWSDAGDVDAEYRADTKLYINKRLVEVTS